jgi:hypothetical protein
MLQTLAVPVTLLSPSHGPCGFEPHLQFVAAVRRRGALLRQESRSDSSSALGSDGSVLAVLETQGSNSATAAFAGSAKSSELASSSSSKSDSKSESNSAMGGDTNDVIDIHPSDFHQVKSLEVATSAAAVSSSKVSSSKVSSEAADAAPSDFQVAESLISAKRAALRHTQKEMATLTKDTRKNADQIQKTAVNYF